MPRFPLRIERDLRSYSTGIGIGDRGFPIDRGACFAGRGMVQNLDSEGKAKSCEGNTKQKKLLQTESTAIEPIKPKTTYLIPTPDHPNVISISPPNVDCLVPIPARSPPTTNSVPRPAPPTPTIHPALLTPNDCPASTTVDHCQPTKPTPTASIVSCENPGEQDPEQTSSMHHPSPLPTQQTAETSSQFMTSLDDGAGLISGGNYITQNNELGDQHRVIDEEVVRLIFRSLNGVDLDLKKEIICQLGKLLQTKPTAIEPIKPNTTDLIPTPDHPNVIPISPIHPSSTLNEDCLLPIPASSPPTANSVPRPAPPTPTIHPALLTPNDCPASTTVDNCQPTKPTPTASIVSCENPGDQYPEQTSSMHHPSPLPTQQTAETSSQFMTPLDVGAGLISGGNYITQNNGDQLTVIVKKVVRPIFRSWNDVYPDLKKEIIRQLVLTYKWEMNPTIEEGILHHCSLIYREMTEAWYEKMIKGKSPEQYLRTVPEEVCPKDWVEFCKMMICTKIEELSPCTYYKESGGVSEVVLKLPYEIFKEKDTALDKIIDCLYKYVCRYKQVPKTPQDQENVIKHWASVASTSLMGSVALLAGWKFVYKEPGWTLIPIVMVAFFSILLVTVTQMLPYSDRLIKKTRVLGMCQQVMVGLLLIALFVLCFLK